MRRATPTNLVVTYHSNPTIYFQVVKLQDVKIITQHLPANAQSGDASR